MITVLQKLGFIKNKSNEISESITILNELLNNYKPESLLTNNKAKQIALKIKDKTPLIYSSNELTEVVGLRWKQQFNENPKILAYSEVLPEATHNQIAIFEYHNNKSSNNLIAIFLRSSFERTELKKRIDGLKDLLMKDYKIEVLEFWGKGNTLLSQLLSLTFLGDFVSFYLSSLLERDPSPTVAMSKLKNRLGLTDLTPPPKN